MKLKFSGKKRLALLLSVVLIVILIYFLLPVGQLFRDQLSPVLFSDEGELLSARLAADGQWRFPRGEKVPGKFFKALLQFEDRRFYLHPGVDPAAVVRACWQNLRAGKIKSGASTVTMQLVRISKKGKRRTLAQKIKEAVSALKVELHYSKKKILSLFAANAPFGGNIVGIDAASWFYFSRSPEELSWGEACFLAVLPKNPTLIGSEAGKAKILEKRNNLLRKLLRCGLLNDLEYQLALAEPLPDGIKPVPRETEHLLDSLAKDKNGKTPFRSFIKADLQRNLNRVSEAQAEKLLARGIRNLAVVIADNRQATVVAYVGNVGLSLEFDCGQHVDVAQSPRSTGSILKPFLYALLFQEGAITPEMLIPDIPTRYEGFRPKNFDRKFRGAVPAKTALVWSLNVPAVRILHQYGIPKFKNKLNRWGMTTLFRPADDYGLSLILGGAEGKLLEITSLYAQMAMLALGLPDGAQEVRLLKDERPSPSRMKDISQGAAYLTLQALTEVNRPDEEGFWRNFSSSRWVAWKTGTSFGLKDAWAVGVTPNYTVGVWAGNADGEGRPEITGLSAAAPVLFEILALIDGGGEIPVPHPFLKPVEVCRDSGYLAGELCPKKVIWVPVESRVTRACPFHQVVHIDPSGRFRVDSRVESVARMKHKTWFVLPPVQEYYYRSYHPEYELLPPFKPSKNQEAEMIDGPRVMNLVYPEPETAVYIPIDLDGQSGEVVFEAVHRLSDAVIHWHLDEDYLTTTRHFHKLILNPEPGEHVLVLVDGEGHRLVRRFSVISKRASNR